MELEIVEAGSDVGVQKICIGSWYWGCCIIHFWDWAAGICGSECQRDCGNLLSPFFYFFNNEINRYNNYRQSEGVALLAAAHVLLGLCIE